jgi:hypothetical protein
MNDSTKIFLAVFAVTPALALGADDPQATAWELGGNFTQCKPSCYPNEHAVPRAGQELKRGCGFKYWSVQQKDLGGGRYGRLEMRGIPAGDPEPVECKAMPPTSGGKWAATSQEMRGLFKQYQGDLKDLRFVVHQDWTAERDAQLNRQRWTQIRVYASNWAFNPNECGAYGNISCEAAGSKTARALNYVRYRLDEAKGFEKDNAEACRISSFEAVATARGLVKFRAARRAKNQWSAGVTYKTRYDGSLTEDELFKKVAAYEKEAEALHVKCGGVSPLVTAVTNDPMRSEPEFHMLPNPDEE